ncbi:hypothetical protein EN962_21280, partial [Mesorhizobium sp. M7A.F.Ca.CA.001.09.2.1]
MRCQIGGPDANRANGGWESVPKQRPPQIFNKTPLTPPWRYFFMQNPARAICAATLLFAIGAVGLTSI